MHREGFEESPANLSRYLALARLAVVAVCGFVVAFGVEPSSGSLPPALTRGQLLLYNVIAGLYGLSAWTSSGRRRLGLTLADIVEASLVVAVTGSYDSPYFAMFLFAVAEAALYFSFRISMALVITMNGAQLAVAAIRVAAAQHPAHFSPIENRFVLLFVVGLLFVVLAEGLRREGRVRRSAQRASIQYARLNAIYAQMGSAHLELEKVLDAIFSAVATRDRVLFAAVLRRTASESQWKVAATSRQGSCPIGTELTDDFLQSGTPTATTGVRVVSGVMFERVFPCLTDLDCGQLVLCDMPAWTAEEQGMLAVGMGACRPLEAEEAAFLQGLTLQAQFAIHNALLYRKSHEELGRVKAFNEMQDTFFTAAAHELKTPLTVLGLLTSTLRMTIEPPSPEQTEMFATIEQSVRRLQAHTENLLSAARLETGNVVLRRRPTDPKAVMLRQLTVLERVLREKSVTVVIEPESEWPKILADPDRLGEVFSNLLSNAWKFAPESTSISIRCVKTGRDARFSVCDEGRGIPDNERDRVFDKAYTGRNVGASGGTGIGLYVARQIVHLHGGSVWLDSQPGATCFRFSLPLASAKDDSDHE